LQEFKEMGYPFPFVEGTTEEDQLLWEERKIKMQIHMEDTFASFGETNRQKTVILCDRGVVDSKYFVGADNFADIISHNGWSEESLLNRYDLVVHVTSTAVGLPEVYEQQKANNPARWETVEQAAAQDTGLKSCWMSHRHHHTLDNSTNFDQKIQSATDVISGSRVFVVVVIVFFFFFEKGAFQYKAVV
jgi:hypothetical protein